jgi:yecA family protein
MRMHSARRSNVTNEPATAPLDYDTLRDALVQAGAVMALAELHGGVAGALCAGGAAAAASWLEACLRDQELEVDAELDAALKDIVAVTARALEEREFAFEPLLPADDAPLEEQVQALAVWCHGFVTALGANAPELVVRGRGAAGGPVDEVFRDFAEISRAALSEEEAAGQDQPDFALAELHEYVRAGVQMVFEELAPRRAAALDVH